MRLVDRLVQVVVHRSVGAHSVPAVTKMLTKHVAGMGGNADAMILDLKRTLRRAIAKPTSHALLREVGTARGTLEGYVGGLADQPAARPIPTKQVYRRGYGRGYSVGRTQSGKWMTRLTDTDLGMGRSIGTYPTELEARQIGKDTVAKLRAEMAVVMAAV